MFWFFFGGRGCLVFWFCSFFVYLFVGVFWLFLFCLGFFCFGLLEVLLFYFTSHTCFVKIFSFRGVVKSRVTIIVSYYCKIV